MAVYSTFLQRAYDQIIEDVALQELPVVFAIDRAGLVGPDGPTHHGVFDIAYLRNIPDFVVVAPAHKKDLEEALEFSLQCSRPVAIRYPKSRVLQIDSSVKFVLGRAEVVRQGKDVAVLALGSLLEETLACLDDLRRDGIEPLVVNPRFVKPLDDKLLVQIARDFRLLVILEEGVLAGGFGEAVLEFYRSKDLLKEITIERLGLPSEFVTFGKREELFKAYDLDPKGIARRIKKAILPAKGLKV